MNHNGSPETAKKLIDIAAEAGADAVKFQTFKADQVMLCDAPKAAYQINSTTEEESQYEMVRKLELDGQTHIILKKHALQLGIQFLSTPFDMNSLKFLTEVLEVPVIKIASGEITNAPLLLEAARSGKKIILSTGMSGLGDIETALGVLAFGYEKTGENSRSPSIKAFQEAYYSEAGQRLLQKNVTLLHCTTEYPAPFEETNLRVLGALRESFGLRVGFSDHTPGTAIALAAAALGAAIIEKHITLDRNMPGPDHKSSLEPMEFTGMIRGIRQIELALGNSCKKPSLSEIKNREVARKSIVAACPIRKGEAFTEENIAVKRPAGGISPLYYWDMLGKTAVRSYSKDEVIVCRSKA